MNTATITCSVAAPPPWLADLERRIAVTAARSDIDAVCYAAESHCKRGTGWSHWYDIADLRMPDGAPPHADDRATVDDAVRYLDALGLLDHHHRHPTWVRFRDKAR